MFVKRSFSVFLIIIINVSSAYGKPVPQTLSFSKIFGDGMVLQRNVSLPVFGKAEPGKKVTVFLNSQSRSAIAGANGSWLVYFGSEEAGGPYNLIAICGDTIAVHDVLIGDVWICSGQSNMEFQVKESQNAGKDIANAGYSRIRHIQIPKLIAGNPCEDIADAAPWRPATPEFVGSFSAVAYFFARSLYRQLDVPIGLIHVSWGGSMIETWLSKDAFIKDSELQSLVPNLENLNFDSIKNKHPNTAPTGLYNGMIHPLTQVAITGVIWYQGENNTERAYQYRRTFPLMINDWRQKWNQGNFPFYFVQISSFIPGNASKSGSIWAELREAQTYALRLPNTGMAVTTDIGNAHDVHPKNKLDVGERLAAIALHKNYGKAVPYAGPQYQKMKVRGDKVIISFENAVKGLTTKGGRPIVEGFEIAGADKNYHSAKAVIRKNRVVLQSTGVLHPVAARYSWRDDAGAANLMNRAGFPAVPFRTDKWPGITQHTKYSIF